MFDFLVGNDLLSAIVAFAIILIPAVLVHELGHFFAGKSVGITILEFGIGFPPRVGKLFRWGETDFTLNMVPLGGFVRPLGEDLVGPSRGGSKGDSQDDDSARDKKAQDEDEVRAKGIINPTGVNDVPPIPRIYFLAAGAIANFAFALLVFIIVGLTGVPTLVGIRIGIVNIDPDTPLGIAGIQPNDYIEQINGEYFQDAAAFFKRVDELQGQEITLRVRRLNFENNEPDEIFFVTLPAFDTPELDEVTGNGLVYITGIAEGSPAEVAGLQVGDMIFKFGSEDLTNSANPVKRLQELTLAKVGEEVTLQLYRDGQIVSVSLEPRANPPQGEGAIGIAIGSQSVVSVDGLAFLQAGQLIPMGLPIGESISYGTGEFLDVFRLIFEFPVRLLRGGTEPAERRIVSVVGISQFGGEILQDSVQEGQGSDLLQYMALINIALGFTNLLPIPALDGGRILFVVAEMVRGKPIPPESEGMVHLIGLIFLLSIGVFFIINDLVNPLTDMMP